MINTIYALRQRRAKERWKSVKEQILLFHFENETRLNAVRKALLPLHIACKVVPREEWDTPLGALVGLETAAQPDLPAEELREEVLFLCGLTNAGIQLTVAALRKAGLYIPYKASLTPTNKDWTVRQLFSEIYQEHQAMHSRQERVHTEE